MAKSELLSSISSIVLKNPRSEIPNTKIEAEAYLNGTSQGELVLSLSKEHPRTHGRTTISVVRLRRIREIFGLR
jgi:hypothetical protein